MRGIFKKTTKIDFTPAEIMLEIDREAEHSVKEKHDFSRAQLLLCLFAFVFTAVLTFLLSSNIKNSSAASASDFHVGSLISDYVMTNSGSMTEAEIQAFLSSKVSCNYSLSSLKTNIKNSYGATLSQEGNTEFYSWTSSGGTTYQFHIKNDKVVCLANELFGDGTTIGSGETAAHIIWQAAQDYQINPQVLIVLLEKEQGLITDNYPNSIQYRKATGYGCPDTAACDSAYFGFKNQVRRAAELFRKVMDGKSSYYPIGNNNIAYSPSAGCGSSTVYVENLATSALYRYTPYQPNVVALNAGYGTGDSCSSYGNRNFVYYYTDWFGDTQASSGNNVYLPDGIYNIVSTSGLALTFASSEQNATAYIDTNNNSATQQFYFQRSDSGYYTIVNVGTELTLDVINGNTSVDSTQLQLYGSNDTCAQKWRVEITDAETFKIKNYCSGKALDIKNGSITATGTTVQIYTANGTAAQEWVLKNVSATEITTGTNYNLVDTSGLALATANEKTVSETKLQIGIRHNGSSEQFSFERDTSGYYYLKNKASGLYVDVTSAGTANYTTVQLYKKNGTCAQRWVASKNSDGSFTFLNACSGKAIDISDGKTAVNNRTVQIYTNNGTSAQKWTLSEPPEKAIEEGEYLIVSKLSSSMVADVTNGSNKNGANLQLYTANGTSAQNFATVSYDADTGYYVIKNTDYNRVLDVSNSGTVNGTNVQVWSYDSSVCAQRWIIVDAGSGYYNILSSCSRAALDVSNGSSKNGANIQIYEYNGTSAQKWSFKERSSSSSSSSSQVVADGTYQILSAINSNYALDLDTTGGWKDGSNVQIYPASSHDAQKFKITYNSKTGYYTLVNVGANLAVDVKNGSSKSEVNLQGYTVNGTCAQNWTITKTSDGYYSFKNACGGKMLDVYNGVAKDHQNVWTYTGNSTDAQKWTLKAL